MERDIPPPSSPVLTVSALNSLARSAVENALPLVWVGGEISNLTRAASGHWYFSLKDDRAQVRCAMFRGRNQFVDWQPPNGDQVEVRAVATVYEARGEFQLQVELMRRAGLGALFEAFERLKQKLAAEGLFESARKRPLPAFPKQLGLVTSPEAAALRDVLTTLRRRAPWLPITLYPTPVQGEGAGRKIAAAIQAAGERAECDVLIVCRGGGSIEGATRRGFQHAQSLEAFIKHVPGLKVVAPSTAYDAKGLLKSAVRDDNPVIVFEHKLLYGSKGPRSEAGALSPIGEVPEEEYLVPIGKGVIRREGRDVTIVGKLLTMYRALEAAEIVAKDGIDVEVIDLRTLKPLDIDTIIASVKKTGRLVGVTEAYENTSFINEVMAQVNERAFDYLDAPMMRVAAANVPVPRAEALEDKAIPNVSRIVAACRKAVS